jgi:hypothetical protein
VRRNTSASTILFLAANPLQVPTLQLDIECRGIEDVIAKATFREEVRFQARRAVQLDDLVQALNDHQTTVIHFSGHGFGEDGICLQEKDGSAAVVRNDEFVEKMVRTAGDGVIAVVLNACCTEIQARALVGHFPCVVGTCAAIGDHAAIEYSRYFYRALASGRSIANAHEQGVAAARHARGNGLARDVVVAADAPRQRDIATLLTRPDVDADRVYIAGPGTARAASSKPQGSSSRAERRKRGSSIRART